MGFEAATDELVDALRLVVGTGVNGALSALYERNPVEITFGYPVPLDQLPQLSLPALSVYRVNDALVSTGTRQDEVQTEIALDYFGPPVGLKALDTCWALLRQVWAETTKAILEDSDGSLCDAGVVGFDETSVRAAYSFATDGSNSFPFFAGRATFVSRPVKQSNAKPFRQLLVEHRLYADGAVVDTECDPVVEQELRSTGVDPGAFDTGFGETDNG